MRTYELPLHTGKVSEVKHTNKLCLRGEEMKCSLWQGMIFVSVVRKCFHLRQSTETHILGTLMQAFFSAPPKKTQQ